MAKKSFLLAAFASPFVTQKVLAVAVAAESKVLAVTTAAKPEGVAAFGGVVVDLRTIDKAEIAAVDKGVVAFFYKALVVAAPASKSLQSAEKLQKQAPSERFSGHFRKKVRK